ncbi:MAG: hypothetical protein KJZ74_15220 [Gemmatimonadales bacterium]|nr:hypothetical protein [Gemmatimonadota bacterium]MCL4215255.1 hypothetical protein [Gemmatimonadales bacterium]
MRRYLTATLLLLVATACVSKSEYDRQIEQVAAISAEKDSLLMEVVQNSDFIAAVNSELDRVKNSQPVAKGAGEMESMSPTQRRAALAERVKALTERVRESEERLAQSRRRVTSLTADNATMQAQLTAFDSTVRSFQTLIENQKAEIVALLDQVSILTSENMALREANTTLESERATLTSEKSALTAEQNTVYWVAGKKDELLRRGIIEQRGGMLGIGKTQVLARTLDASEFTAIDRTAVLELALPDAAKSYKMVSTNDVAGLDSPPADGKFKGVVKIASPETFWRTSKFLVLIEQ